MYGMGSDNILCVLTNVGLFYSKAVISTYLGILVLSDLLCIKLYICTYSIPILSSTLLCTAI